jgi:hypothetical protein
MCKGKREERKGMNRKGAGGKKTHLEVMKQEDEEQGKK